MGEFDSSIDWERFKKQRIKGAIGKVALQRYLPLPRISMDYENLK